MIVSVGFNETTSEIAPSATCSNYSLAPSRSILRRTGF